MTRSQSARTAAKQRDIQDEVAQADRKDKGDKRRTIADREAKRQMDRALKSRR